MKRKNLKKIILSMAFAFAVSFSFAQMMSPGEPGGEPDPGDDPIGGSAPISGGITLLLTLGAIYGGSKVYHLYKDDEIKEKE